MAVKRSVFTQLSASPQTQLSLIEAENDLKFLPSAKMRPSDKIGVHAWTNFYAAFSEKFASAALEALGARPGDRVLDPFVGSGTTLVSALQSGITGIGIDLDPFACLLGRAKIALKADRDTVRALLASSKRSNHFDSFDKTASATFSHSCLCYATAVFERLYKKTGSDRHNFLQKILSDTKGLFDSEVVALVALCKGAEGAARLVRGSNPTWYRLAVAGEKNDLDALRNLSLTSVDQMLADLQLLNLKKGKRNIRIFNYDSTELNSIKIPQVDFVVTSPPYLTRIDYVVKHLPNLLILSGLINIDMESLRRKMIGTPKILKKTIDNKSWGPLCISTLHAIREHESYASKSYYVWTYQQYFSSIYSALRLISQTLKSNGSGLLVVQDSLYKDIHIELSNIIVEMMQGLGLSAEIVGKDRVKMSLRRLNPALNQGGTRRESTEDVIYFKNSCA